MTDKHKIPTTHKHTLVPRTQKLMRANNYNQLSANIKTRKKGARHTQTDKQMQIHTQTHTQSEKYTLVYAYTYRLSLK